MYRKMCGNLQDNIDSCKNTILNDMADGIDSVEEFRTTTKQLDDMSEILVTKYNEILKIKKNLSKDFIDGNLNILKENYTANSSADLVNITAYFDDATHYNDNLRSSAAFVYNFNGGKYLVSCAHSVILNWQTVDNGEVDGLTRMIFANRVVASCIDKSWKKNLDLNKMSYSRIYDVVVFKLENETNGPNGYAASSNSSSKKASISYRDSLTGQKTIIDARYVDKIASVYHLGAFALGLTSGSSGSAVIDVVHNGLIAMISSVTSNYENMTITVPITVINNIIKYSSFTTKYNFDGNNRQFTGYHTNLINQDYLNSMPENFFTKLIENNGLLGEMVLHNYKELVLKGTAPNLEVDLDNSILPFDIIKSINGENIGLSKKRLSEVLLSSNLEEANIGYYKMKAEYRNTYFSYPRTTYFKLRYGDGIWNSTDNELNDDGTGDNLISLLGNLILKDFSVNGNIITFNLNINLDDNIIIKGQTIKYYKSINDKKFSLFKVTEITGKSITLDLNGKTAPTDTGVFHLYPRSTTYAIQPNIFYDNGSFDFYSSHYYGLLKENSIQDIQSELGFKTTPILVKEVNMDANNDGELDNTEFSNSRNIYKADLDDRSYKTLILITLIRCWATIICRGISGMNYARQIIIIANEMERLLKVLCRCSSSEAGVIYRIIIAVMFHQFLEKVVEFANINAMNLIGIFWQKVIQHRIANDNIDAADAKLEAASLIEYNLGFYSDLDNLCSLESDINNLIDTDENSDTYEQFIYDEKKANGYSSFALSGVHVDELLHKPYFADGVTESAKNNDASTEPRNLEALYKEMNTVIGWSGEGIYYPRHLHCIQDLWDHSHITWANVLDILSNKADLYN